LFSACDNETQLDNLRKEQSNMELEEGVSTVSTSSPLASQWQPSLLMSKESETEENLT